MNQRGRPISPITYLRAPERRATAELRADMGSWPGRNRRRFLLGLLFTAGVGASWTVRLHDAGAAAVVTLPAGTPVLATPIPEARQLPGTRALRVQGVGEVWEAPALPAQPDAAAGPGPVPVSQVGGAFARTPAGEVDRWVQRLAGAQRAEMQRALERMAAFEPLIHHALRERGLPRDLLYLALIESGYLPTATSRAGAAGIWQFMPATARGYGLEVSEYVDERRDPVRSTYAAVRHLQSLYRQFGSWHLALAAYNAGDGRVGGTLRSLSGGWHGEEILYWRVRPHLPAETQEYVPKLLAASRVARAREQYGFVTLEHRPPLRFREVSVPGGIALAEVAEAVGVTPQEIYELNPHLIRRTTPPGRRWPVRIPVALPLQASR